MAALRDPASITGLPTLASRETTSLPALAIFG